MNTDRPRPDAGISLLEVLVTAGLIALVSVAAMAHLTSGWRQAEQNRDRRFAYEKAQSILEELRAFAETSETQEAAQLDQFDDGTGFSYTLSIARQPAPNDTQLVDPQAPVSGNARTNGRWRYARRISVRHFAGLDTRDLRVVTVRIFLNADATAAPGHEIANISTVIRTIADGTPPTQVYDLYLVAIENVPGWWVYMDTIRPFVEASLSDLEARNPGLSFRTHWITKLAYGRNPQYTPYFNDTAPSTDPIDRVYFYPGRMPTGSAAARYYVPENVRARVNVDETVRNGYDAVTNPWPYALADQYNHAMRLPEEEDLFARRVAAGAEDPAEPTWRLLLERMNTAPDQFRNAIIVNLHGELLAMPPLRNYSDAAREPESHPGVRAVTHPERILFRRDAANPAASQDVRLRVHTYKTVPAAGASRLDVPVIVEIPGLDLTTNVNGASSPTLLVNAIRGGLDLLPPFGAQDPYVNAPAPVVVGNGAYTVGSTGEMYARVRYVSPGGGLPGSTVVELHNSPLVAPFDSTSLQGLAPGKWLYGMEYVPCSTEAANDFSSDLTRDGDVEKNTARWVITIPASMLGSADRSVAAVTRIGLGDGGDDGPDGHALATGIMWPPESRHQPENVSRTWCWFADSAEDVPVTERYQFQGDPRHCPYADLKSGGASWPNGYNWYFDDLEDAAGNALSRWPGFDAARLKNDGTVGNDGWEARIEADVPRLLQLLRGGLVRSEALWTTLTGFSYYYVGLGGEVGYDASNGFPSSIPVSGLPFGAAGAGFEQSITGGGTWGGGVKYVRSNAGGSYWWGMPWLGELYPDGAYATHWRVPRHEYSDTLPLPATLPAPKGNLPAGDSADATKFRRAQRSSIGVNLPWGTTLRYAERRMNAEGCTSLFNVGTSSSTFHHQYRDGTYGDLAAPGGEIATDFNFPLPTTTRVSRPFRVATSADGGVGDEFGHTSDYPRYSATVRKTYYTHSSGATGSALVELADPSGDSAYVLVSGIDRTTESGSAFIARYAMLTLIHGFLSAGEPSLPDPVPVRPRITVTGPTAVTELADPVSIPVSWRTEWRRWDGSAYTSNFAAGFTAAETAIEYVLLYSADNGQTWRHMQDDSAATPGVRPSNSALRVPDAIDGGDETYTWATPAAAFPAGSYRVRIEAYRVGGSLHYSYHDEKVYISR